MQTVQKNKFLLAALSLALAAATSVKMTSAQTQGVSAGTAREVALTAVPPRLGDDYTLVVKPGQTIQAAIEVRNPSNSIATVETSARDFYVGEDGETPMPVEAEDVNTRWALAKWITLTPNNETIEPRQSATILVTISVPQDALPGGRYAMILHKPVTSGADTTSTGAQINAQVGTLLYVVVDGDLTEDAEVESFKFTPDFLEMGPADYELKILNKSSMHIRPTGTIAITNMLGKTVGRIDIDSRNIFPESARAFNGSWNKTWGFGKYTATFTGTYGTQSNQLNGATTFWIVPVRLILAVILAVILVAVVVVATRTKYSKMLEAEEEKVRKLDEKLKKARKSNK